MVSAYPHERNAGALRGFGLFHGRIIRDGSVMLHARQNVVPGRSLVLPAHGIVQAPARSAMGRPNLKANRVLAVSIRDQITRTRGAHRAEHMPPAPHQIRAHEDFVQRPNGASWQLMIGDAEVGFPASARTCAAAIRGLMAAQRGGAYTTHGGMLTEHLGLLSGSLARAGLQPRPFYFTRTCASKGWN